MNNSDKYSKFRKIIMLKAIPGAGKTTWAKEQVRKNPFSMARICRDDFRSMLSEYVFSIENEALVTSLRDQAITTALKRGYDVIVDEKNLDKRAFGKMVSLVRKLNINCLVMEKPFYIPFEEACKRNKARDRVVPDNIMKKMWAKSGEKRFKGYEGRTETVLANEGSMYAALSAKLNDENLPKCVLVDLDGTISLFNKEGENKYPFAHTRNAYNASTCNNDSPNMPVVDLVHLFHDAGHKIIFCSGREDTYKKQTIEFLTKHIDSRVDYDLYMRREGDTRKNWLIKEQILKQNVVGKYRVYMALDDRNMMVDHYRLMGLSVWQTAPGDF